MAGLAVVVAIGWPTAPGRPVASTGDQMPRAAPNAWLAAAHGDGLTRADDGNAASVDPFSSGAPAAGAPAAARPPRIWLAAPVSLAVGDVDDVVVAIDASAPLGRLSFNVAMNGDVLQVQSGAQGDWTADPRAGFRMEIAPGDDRVAVEAMAGHAKAQGLSGSVVRIHVQAMAAGTTDVRLTDIRAEDDRGRPLAIAPVDATARVAAQARPPMTTANAVGDRAARPVADMSTSD